MAERNPVEIAWAAVKSEVSRATLIRAFAAIEAAGCRIVDTENVTEEMVEACLCETLATKAITAALLAAPKFGDIK